MPESRLLRAFAVPCSGLATPPTRRARSSSRDGRAARRLTSSPEIGAPSRMPPFMERRLSLAFPKSLSALATDAGSPSAHTSAVCPTRYSRRASVPAWSQARRARVFFTTWNCPPLARRRPRRSSTSRTLRPWNSVAMTVDVDESLSAICWMASAFCSLFSSSPPHFASARERGRERGARGSWPQRLGGSVLARVRGARPLGSRRPHGRPRGLRSGVPGAARPRPSPPRAGSA